MTRQHRLIAALSLSYIGSFAALGVVLPYLPLWLTARGMAPADIGVALATGLLARLILAPLVGRLADRAGRRAALLLAAGGGGAVSLAFPLIEGPATAALLVGLTSGLWTAGAVVTDAASLDAERAGAAHYSRLRATGSAAFLAVSLGYGAALPWLGLESLVWAHAAGFGLALLGAAMLPDDRTAASGGGSFRQGLWRAFRDPALAATMVAMALIQNSHHFLYGFASLRWREAGLSEAAIGWLWAEGVIVEIALFWWAPRLATRFGARALLIAAGLAAAVRWIAIAEIPTLTAMLALQGLHAVSFGCAHLALQQVLRDRAPAGGLASVQGVFAALPMGVGGALASALAGALYQRWGGDAFWAAAAMAALGLSVARWLPGRAARADRVKPDTA